MKYLILLLVTFTSLRGPAQITNVEHFYASSPDAERLFHFFKNNFQLTTVWNYEDWGNYESGGLMIGTTPLEFITFKNSKSAATGFAGIALEPNVRVNTLMNVYDSLHISYGNMFVDTFTENTRKDTGFINLEIKNVLPGNIYFFTCDYKYRGEMDSMEMRAADSLKNLHGGSLGIVALKEIVVGCVDVEACAKELSKLPGIKKEENNLFSFSKGPSIHLIHTESAGIQKIIVRVSSLADAKKYLHQKNMAGEETNKVVMINPELIAGLKIELTDEWN